ncbi:MAG: sigma-70 family RNA polymerase sigma factor [Acidobacteria bacterium]|nr:sigma-70 family RNA polymerase sigma factor [Acidobacteriota bacterium]
MTPSDAELVRQALAGSQAAYRTLVARYAAAAVNMAARLVHDRAVAEELAQDAFVRAFARLATYDPDRRFSAWFFRVLHNVVVDYMRRRRVETVSLDALQAEGYPGPAEAASSPEDELERRALGSALGAALSRLRAEYREVIVLRYQQGLTVEEIAGVLKLPEGTVKTFLHRARKELAAMLEAAGWKPRDR